MIRPPQRSTLFPYPTLSRSLSFSPPHQHDEIRHLLSTALAAVVSLRLVPKKDGQGRVPGSEGLINTAAGQDNIRDILKQLNIPDRTGEHTAELQARSDVVCPLLPAKKKSRSGSASPTSAPVDA